MNSNVPPLTAVPTPTPAAAEEEAEEAAEEEEEEEEEEEFGANGRHCRATILPFPVSAT